MLSYEQLASSVSTEFLCNPLPSNWDTWSDKELLDYIDNNLIETFDRWAGESVLDMILSIAYTINQDQDIDE